MSEGELRDIDDRQEAKDLLSALKNALPSLRALLQEVNGHWGAEDLVYRFYHHSFKVYGLQQETTKMVSALQALAPERELNRWFQQILAEGTGKHWDQEHNRRWLEETRPILEAFFHARYFLEMAVKYGAELDVPPALLPSGWAALLYLYDLR